MVFYRLLSSCSSTIFRMSTLNNYIIHLVWLLFSTTSVYANNYDNQMELAVNKIIDNFESEGRTRRIDEYTNLIKIQYLRDRKTMTLIHEVDINGMLNEDYLDKSNAIIIKNANKTMICLSEFGVLLKNNLINIEHIFIDKKSKYLVLRYLISAKDCVVKK